GATAAYPAPPAAGPAGYPHPAPAAPTWQPTPAAYPRPLPRDDEVDVELVTLPSAPGPMPVPIPFEPPASRGIIALPPKRGSVAMVKSGRKIADSSSTYSASPAYCTPT